MIRSLWCRFQEWRFLRRVPRPGKEFGDRVRAAREVSIEELECVEAGLFEIEEGPRHA